MDSTFGPLEREIICVYSTDALLDMESLRVLIVPHQPFPLVRVALMLFPATLFRGGVLVVAASTILVPYLEYDSVVAYTAADKCCGVVIFPQSPLGLILRQSRSKLVDQ